MHDSAALMASISKHTIGGIVFVVIAIALIAWGAVIIAVLLFTRAV
jgi:hypothetical protein